MTESVSAGRPGAGRTDPLAPLLDLAGVAGDLADARDRVDAALRHPALRRRAGAVAAEVGLRSAVATAALCGHPYPREDVRAGIVTDPVVQGALRVSREAGTLAPLWQKVPRQVLARIHVLCARDVTEVSRLGRPVSAAVLPRLSTLLALVAGGTSVPCLLLAAVVHGELLALRPFGEPARLVAAAAARVTLVAGGLDPHGLLPVEEGHLARQPEYQGAAGAFATGTPDGIRSWLRHYTAAVSAAATQLTGIADQTARPAG